MCYQASCHCGREHDPTGELRGDSGDHVPGVIPPEQWGNTGWELVILWYFWPDFPVCAELQGPECPPSSSCRCWRWRSGQCAGKQEALPGCGRGPCSQTAGWKYPPISFFSSQRCTSAKLTVKLPDVFPGSTAHLPPLVMAMFYCWFGLPCLGLSASHQQWGKIFHYCRVFHTFFHSSSFLVTPNILGEWILTTWGLWILVKIWWTLWNDCIQNSKLYAVRMSSQTPQSLSMGNRLKILCLMKELVGVKMKLEILHITLPKSLFWT